MVETIRDSDGREYTVYFTGYELKGIASGSRHVKVLSSGSKWVVLQIGNKKRKMLRDKWIKMLDGEVRRNQQSLTPNPIKRRIR
jgi:hypothetical protein